MLALTSGDCLLRVSVVCLRMASLDERNSADNAVRNALDNAHSRGTTDLPEDATNWKKGVSDLMSMYAVL